MILSILVTLGTLNPAVTQATVATTICRPGWTATVRPPSWYTSRLKRRQLGPSARMQDYEEDHLMPLAIGGAPRDPANLAPQPIRQARVKDTDERRAQVLVCSGRWTLAQAQGWMAGRWGR